MTVGELIDFLATRPRDLLVVMSSDAEGNGYSPLSEADDARYLAESTWSGELVDSEDSDGNDGDPVVALWPVG